MSRIDDAITRRTGRQPEPRPQSRFVRFLSEGLSHAEVGDADYRPPSLSKAAREALDAEDLRHRRRMDSAVREPKEWQKVVNYGGYALRALLRRKWLVAFTFIFTFALTVGLMTLMPPTYFVETSMISQRNHLMASLTNPGRTVPYDADAPTRAAAETILRRDNILALIRETKLLEHWEENRAPILRLRDRLRAMILRRPKSLDDTLDEIITQIERKMDIDADHPRDGLVTIGLEWPDPRGAYELVTRSQQAFVDARQAAETQTIGEAITVLERHAESLNRGVKLSLAELARARERIEAALPPARRAAPPPISFVARALDTPDPLADIPSFLDDPLVDPSAFSDPRLGRIKNLINAKRNELQRVEGDAKRRLTEVQAQLSAARMIYTPNHPTIQSLQQSVASLQHDTPQVSALQNEIDRLEIEADDQAAAEAERLIRATVGQQRTAPPRRTSLAPQVSVTPTPATAPEPQSIEELGQPRRDAVADFATMRLRSEVSQLHSIIERTDAARIELAASQAAFKSRYTVIQPAEEPGAPSFPRPRRVLVAALLASLLFAFLTGIAADIRGKRILEPWQVPHQLRLPLLGKVRLS